MTPYELATAEIGTPEWQKGHNPKIVAYFKDAGSSHVTDDETAWCAAFVGAVLHRCGYKGTGKLNARSYLDWGLNVDYRNAQAGDIVIFKRGNSSWQGHVGFFVKDHGAFVEILGGNQGNSVSRRKYKKSELLGVRRLPVKPVVVEKPATTVVTRTLPWWQRLATFLKG